MRKEILIAIVFGIIATLACSGTSGDATGATQNEFIKSFAPTQSLAAPAVPGNDYVLGQEQLPGDYQFVSGTESSTLTCKGVTFTLEVKNNHLKLSFPPGNNISGYDAYRIETVAGCHFDVGISYSVGGGYNLTIYK